MASKSREWELSRSLMDLQSQFNEMVKAKDDWRNKYQKLRAEQSELIRGFDSALSSKNEEIEELRRLLDGAKNLVESMKDRAKPKARRNAEGTET